jgi:ribulose-phosphate 3-epimerase
MSKMIRIAPSILAADFTRLGEQLKQVEDGGGDLIHIDVMDGSFVPNITMGPLIVQAARRATRLPLDVHLMIVEPARHLEAFAKAGADRITVHVESNPHLHSLLMTINKLGCKAGVAINPHTPAEAIAEVIHMLDVILVMTVNPGFGGQKFIPETLAKLARLRAMIEQTGKEIDLSIDGGINTQTAPTVVKAGATILVAGSAVFNTTQSVAENIAILRHAIKNENEPG